MSNLNFDSKYIEEPEIKFADGESKDPRAGLIKYGPRTPSARDEHKVAKVGIIGSANSIAGLEELFHQMSGTITSSDSRKRWKPPFPGLGEDSILKLSIDNQKRWREKISRSEIEKVKDQFGKKEKIEKAIEIVKEKIQLIYEKETPPDLVVISIPDEIYEACTNSKSGDAKMQTDTIDFRNRLKLIGMQKGIPTQLVKPKTLRGEGTQDKSDVAWNLAVGMLYKARKGHPWKLTELEEGTCFVGLSFYQEKGDSNRTRTSMAQVFLETGESFILRGDPFEGEKLGRGNNHLSEEDAEKLIEQVIDYYEKNKGHRPSRLVIHKSSYFWDEEKEGFLKGAEDIPEKDFITIHSDSNLRAFSSKDYPVLRGTLLKNNHSNKIYLFTKGYVPSLATFPGPGIPSPLEITPDSEVNDSSYKKICREIMRFTKLDWNTSHFSRKEPVTIVVSRSVGPVLAEASLEEVEIDPHYYYYM